MSRLGLAELKAAARKATTAKILGSPALPQRLVAVAVAVLTAARPMAAMGAPAVAVVVQSPEASADRVPLGKAPAVAIVAQAVLLVAVAARVKRVAPALPAQAEKVVTASRHPLQAHPLTTAAEAAVLIVLVVAALAVLGAAARGPHLLVHPIQVVALVATRDQVDLAS